jgi:hypothetical protein
MLTALDGRLGGAKFVADMVRTMGCIKTRLQ